MIRHAKIDRYMFEQLLNADADAIERVRSARKEAPWFTEDLLADVFYSFYLPSPTEEAASGEPPFHRWIVRTLRQQYLYATIRPRTAGSAAAAFRTALKALMWLTAEYAEEAAKRKRDQQEMPRMAGQSPLGFGGSSGEGDEMPIAERLDASQLERLKALNYRLESGKRSIEERQTAADSKPLVEEEIAALRSRIAELKERMRTDFLRREKWKKKLEQAETQLAGRKKALERLEEAERKAFSELDQELGEWLNRSLKEALTEEEQETKLLDELIRASLRFANRRWGSSLGRLRRQAYAQYLAWVERLKRHPDLIAMIEEVGRNTEQLKRRLKQADARTAPDRYDQLGLSGDLAHMLPSEASLLADEDYEAYFMQKWLDGKLLTYRANDADKDRGKGPVICLLDTSHSMHGAKQRLAQIFVMTFAALTLSEQRDFVLLLFGSKGELIERPFFHRRPDWPAFYNLSQLAFGGGTNFDTPLRRSMQLIREARGFSNADIVMVTDGIGAVSAPVRDELASLGESISLRLFTLIVGSARQHLLAPYDIMGVSHSVRFAAGWDAQEGENSRLLLDVFAPAGSHETTSSGEQ